jgi:uncharacterized phage protein (TIGR02216 family)
MSFGQRAAELAGLAASRLGWRPDEFWNSTPDELAAALGLRGQSTIAIDTVELERLRSLFPDKREN